MSIFTLRVCFYLINLLSEERFEEFDEFLEKFENSNKSVEDISYISKNSGFRIMLLLKMGSCYNSICNDW